MRVFIDIVASMNKTCGASLSLPPSPVVVPATFCPRRLAVWNTSQKLFCFSPQATLLFLTTPFFVIYPAFFPSPRTYSIVSLLSRGVDGMRSCYTWVAVSFILSLSLLLSRFASCTPTCFCFATPAFSTGLVLLMDSTGVAHAVPCVLFLFSFSPLFPNSSVRCYS